MKKLFKPKDVEKFARDTLGLDVVVKEKETTEHLILKYQCRVPQGVVINGKATDVFHSQIKGRKQSDNTKGSDITGYVDKAALADFLCQTLAISLKILKIMIDKGEITHTPGFGAKAS